MWIQSNNTHLLSTNKQNARTQNGKYKEFWCLFYDIIKAKQKGK